MSGRALLADHANQSVERWERYQLEPRVANGTREVLAQHAVSRESVARRACFDSRAGMSELAPRRELAREVAGQLMARNALEAQLETEHGILRVKSRTEVVWAGVGSAVAYALGAAIPLLITLTVPVTAEAWTIVLAVLVSLTVTSIVGARTGRMNVRRTITRTLLVGSWTRAVSYLAGKLLF